MQLRRPCNYVSRARAHTRSAKPKSNGADSPGSAAAESVLGSSTIDSLVRRRNTTQPWIHFMAYPIRRLTEFLIPTRLGLTASRFHMNGVARARSESANGRRARPAALGVSAAKERGEASRDGCDNTDRPQLQHDIDNLADASERILNRRGDGQNLHGGKED